MLELVVVAYVVGIVSGLGIAGVVVLASGRPDRLSDSAIDWVAAKARQLAIEASQLSTVEMLKAADNLREEIRSDLRFFASGGKEP